MAKKKSTSKKGTKSVIFKSAPPSTSYFVGIPVDLPADEADEYIKLEYAKEVGSDKKSKSDSK